MASDVRVGIAGVGYYVPERVVPNTYFEQFCDTSDEWIRQRTGIKERRFSPDDMATSDLSLRAAQRALDDAGVSAEDIDLIVVGTVSPDQTLPAVAPQLQEALGCPRAGAFDVVAACAGFMTALSTAEAFIRAGRAKRVLVIGAETLSRYIDLKDRGSCILFGDGAGAAVLTPWEDCEQGEILRTTLGSDGSGYAFIQTISGGSRSPSSHESVEAAEHAIRVRGRDVYRFAVTRMEKITAEMLEGHDRDELGLVVPHQVNQRIIDAAVQKLEIDPEKVMVNINKYGNTSSASVPIALAEARDQGRLEKGKLVVMCAFGAGLVWGGALVRW